MVAVQFLCNGHYTSIDGALRDGRGRGRRGGSVQKVSGCGEWERTGGRGTGIHGVLVRVSDPEVEEDREGDGPGRPAYVEERETQRTKKMCEEEMGQAQ